MKQINVIIFGIILLMSLIAQSNDLTPQRIELLYKIAKEARIDSNDLIRVAYVESRFKMSAIRNNTNGTIDFGMFQINSVHWSTTCKAYNVMSFSGNAKCAAKLIQDAKKHAGHDSLWLARYHSKTHSKKALYSIQLRLVPVFKVAEVEK